MLATATLLLAATLADPDIHKILADRVDVQRQSVGIVAGVVDPSGPRVVVHGKAGGSAKLDGDTIFEIGSATKVFTALLLADAVARGDVALTDPISKYLPAEVKVPERGGKKITLQDLATHTSGLPRLPSNFAPKDPTNPYADYTVANLYEFLGGYQLPRDIGSEYEYSNLGAGLLGHILALRAGMTYEELVEKRITGPLGMKSTFIAIPEKAKARLAAGHDAELKPAANWDLPTLAGAGALRSTVNDLLIFLSANLGLTKSPLAAAMASTTKVRRPAGKAEVALGWHIAKAGNGNDIFWHNGGTGGYRSFIGFDPKTRTGVVLLSNTSTPEGVDDIGRHLLDPAAPLIKSRTQVAVAPEVLEKYTGRYELQPGFVITVTRENNSLFAQLTGQSRFEIFPESEKKFFYRVVNAQITFEDGKSLVLHQNGRDVPARRLEGEVPAPKVRKEITLDEKILERYVGRYELLPTFVITVTREGNRLFLQATAQPRLEMFPESEREFFLKVVDAQVTFGDDHLVLHQNGMDQRAKKVE